MFLKNSAMWGAVLVHSEASAAPSKVTAPIITASRATVPATGLSAGSPESGRRRPSRPSRRSTGDRRENRLK